VCAQKQQNDGGWNVHALQFASEDEAEKWFCQSRPGIFCGQPDSFVSFGLITSDFMFFTSAYRGSKEAFFQDIQNELTGLGFRVAGRDWSKPWGGFFVIDEAQAADFQRHFFSEVTLRPDELQQKLSPKILVVAPGRRLSWQYHFRRAEIWKLAGGVAGMVRSLTDAEGEVQPLVPGKTVRMEKGERHRLVGAPGGWGIVAEIWIHTDPDQPSNEADIVRLQDDFGR
jgi:mannose-6-phosphate isomerase-like protein (cupin superfamily)